MAYVEVKAKTVEMAIEAAMRELGVDSRDRIDVEVLQEPERGFLGFGGQDAIVKVAERSGGKPRSRGRKSGSKSGGAAPKGKARDVRSQGETKRSDASSRGGQARGGQHRQGNPAGKGSQETKAKSGRPSGNRNRDDRPPKKDDDRQALDTAAQEPLVGDFLRGLVGAFGLEGEVETRVEDDVVIANVVGEQTEALVGQRGSVMEAVHELTKTVLQRTAQDSARVRIDIAGYAERRRQALTIYAGELIRQVHEDGGELMLEPMSASDRKVIHDAVAQYEGVRSYSEGESPKRYVVIAPVDADADAGEEE